MSLGLAGVLAVSTAAIGKAERFLKVYRTVLARWNDRSGFDAGQYTEDPINRLHLHELVDLALGANFEVEIGQLQYQPYQLPNVHAYLNAVRAYGFTSFMAPITPELRRMCGLKFRKNMPKALAMAPMSTITMWPMSLPIRATIEAGCPTATLLMKERLPAPMDFARFSMKSST